MVHQHLGQFMFSYIVGDLKVLRVGKKAHNNESPLKVVLQSKAIKINFLSISHWTLQLITNLASPKSESLVNALVNWRFLKLEFEIRNSPIPPNGATIIYKNKVL